MSFKLIAILAAIFYLLGFLSAVKAIMESRTSQGAIAWALGLITFPYLAVPIYWVFGRSKFQGFVKLLRTGNARSEKTTHACVEQFKKYNFFLSPEREEAMWFEKLVKLPFTTGNEAEILK